MKKLLSAVWVCCLFVSALQAQKMSALQIANGASKINTVRESISYIKSNIDLCATSADKRATYAFLGAVQEQLLLYDDARISYAAAAAIAAGDAQGMPKKSSEQLVIDAIRCALSSGDCETADSYLDSAVKKSQDEQIQAYIRLYTQWSILCRASGADSVREPVIVLNTYKELSSMSEVKPSILLTLWYITGTESYADDLKKEFPLSAEAAVVGGKVAMLPAPFWYFLPRLGSAKPDITDEAQVMPFPKTPLDKAGDSQSVTAEKIIRQQIGLFKKQDNAKKLIEQLERSGFKGYIALETRPSGTVYYQVVVDENANGTIGEQLRTAGFECYPVFSDK